MTRTGNNATPPTRCWRPCGLSRHCCPSRRPTSRCCTRRTTSSRYRPHPSPTVDFLQATPPDSPGPKPQRWGRASEAVAARPCALVLWTCSSCPLRASLVLALMPNPSPALSPSCGGGGYRRRCWRACAEPNGASCWARCILERRAGRRVSSWTRSLRRCRPALSSRCMPRLTHTQPAIPIPLTPPEYASAMCDAADLVALSDVVQPSWRRPSPPCVL